MIDALGLLGVDGMVATVDTTDAMLKTANVRLLNHEVLDPGRPTLVMGGDPTTCRAALDAGGAAAAHAGRIISHKEIGRPDDDTQRLIDDFKRQPKKPEQKPEAKAEVRPEGAQDVSMASEPPIQLLTLLASVRQGMTAGEMAAYFGWSPDEARSALRQLSSDGALRKHSSRYRLKD